MPEQDVDIVKFAEKVERLCDFLLAKKRNAEGGELTESPNTRAILELKDVAADIATGKVNVGQDPIAGLDNYMKLGTQQ